MAEKKSFLSTIPGVVTGIAGLLTGIVGLLSLSLQQGWIGGDSSKSATTVTTVPGAAGSGASSQPGSSGSNSGAASGVPPSISVSPTSVSLTIGKPKQSVTVTNSGQGSVTMDRASLTGGDKDKFQVDDGCNGRLPASGSCTVDVSLGSSGVSGSPATQLLLTPEGGTPVRVDVTAALL